MPNLVDIKLDGKAFKFEQLLQLAPWYPQATAQAHETNEEHRGSSSGGGSTAAAKAQQAGKKKPKIYKVLEFNIKAAAVLVGQEPPAMPASLLRWALQVNLEAGASTCCKGDVAAHPIEFAIQPWAMLDKHAADTTQQD